MERLLTLSLAAAGLVALPLDVRAAVQIEDVKRPPGLGLAVQIAPETETPNALVMSLQGKCSYSVDGTNFVRLEAKDVFAMRPASGRANSPSKTNDWLVLTQGMVLRTEEDSRIDLFFRRVGTKVRLQPGTEVRLEKMERRLKDGLPVMDTLLALKNGRIFIAVRSLVSGSTLEIRNAAGRSVVEGGGGRGRYIVTADGTHVTEKGSAVPLKVIGETGVTIIAPGMQFSRKDGKMLPLEASEAVKLLIEFDELDALAEQWTDSDEAPKKD